MHRKYWLFIGFVLFIILLSSCSAERRFARLQKKHPEIFKVDTTTHHLKASNVSTSFDCNSIARSTKPSIVRLPREYKDANGRVKHDTVYLTLQADTIKADSGRVEAQIDCPDPIVKEVPRPYPVYVKPGFWHILKIAGISIFIFLAIIGITWTILKILIPYLKTF